MVQKQMDLLTLSFIKFILVTKRRDVLLQRVPTVKINKIGPVAAPS